MIKRIIFFAALPLALSLLAGCATGVQVVNGYDGTPLPPAKVAIINTDLNAQVLAVDGRALGHGCSGEMNFKSLRYKFGCKLALTPGKHTLSVGYESSSTSSFGIVTGTTTTLSKYLALVPVSVEAGKQYLVSTDFPPLKVEFSDNGLRGLHPIAILRYLKR